MEIISNFPTDKDKDVLRLMKMADRRGQFMLKLFLNGFMIIFPLMQFVIYLTSLISCILNYRMIIIDQLYRQFQFRCGYFIFQVVFKSTIIYYYDFQFALEPKSFLGLVCRVCVLYDDMYEFLSDYCYIFIIFHRGLSVSFVILPNIFQPH